MDLEWLFLLDSDCLFLLVLGWLFQVDSNIIYTYVGSDTILEVQGRYFLPVLPLGLLAVQGNRKIVAQKSIEAELILAIISLQLYTIWSILSVAAAR